MASSEILAADCRWASSKRLVPLDSATWRDEIAEVLESAGYPPENRPVDADWRAAADFLVRHCLETLGGG